MIIQAFLHWVKTAKATDRKRAAGALARAYVASDMIAADRQAAEMAMTMLLDDPSPKVRLALAQALADCPVVPRQIILTLAADQPEIAFAVISCSPVLNDEDLVDLAARGTSETRAVIANRPNLSRPVAAAIAEIGSEVEVLILLENEAASIARRTLKRICDRLGHHSSIREHLLSRDDLQSDVRHALVEQVGAALAGFGLVQAVIGNDRVARVTREACDQATVGMAASVPVAEIPALVAHLRHSGRLTPAFLLQSLCVGNIDFFAQAIVDLSAVPEKRVRSILGDGRVHAIRALFETAGLGRDVSALFAEALILWRQQSRNRGSDPHAIPAELLARLRAGTLPSASVAAVADLVEKLTFAQTRQAARDYARLAASEFSVMAASQAA